MSARRGAAIAVLVVVALGVAGAAAEMILRVAHIPGITYHTFQFDDVTGQRFYPNTTLIYRSDRGEEVRRKVNSWGYLDRNHDTKKPEGVERIGFFGDSFTEARQVPLDSTFFSRIERGLNARAGAPRTECIAIGMMGYGTLQSWLECDRWMDTLDLDRVVYVFCENDPANLVPALNGSDAAPYPVLVGDSLTIDRSFATRYAAKRTWPHRTWQYLKSHTLLFSTLETRWHLLRSRGVRTRVEPAERMMAATPGAARPLSYNSTPSELPDSLRATCMQLTEHVLLAWNRDVAAAGREFCVLYIPRPSEAAKPAAERDAWESWLVSFCTANGVAIIDPSDPFERAASAGEELFYDHLTSRGHAVLASAYLHATTGEAE
ncbi:MAG TPA: hypothetical protein VF247_02470 [Candidatus Krumholzibacteria bacterium]